jgi:hypothetical protein
MWVTYLGLALLAAVCAFAWFQGTTADRLGCGIYCMAWIIALAFEFVAGDEFPLAAVLTMDALAATGFLILAIRYNNLWLGAAMMLQGVQLGLHAISYTSTDLRLFGYNLFALMLNLISLLILITIAGGVGASAVKRRRERRHRMPRMAATA